MLSLILNLVVITFIVVGAFVVHFLWYNSEEDKKLIDKEIYCEE